MSALAAQAIEASSPPFMVSATLVWAFVKNMPGLLFWLLLPAHILVNLAYLIAAMFMPNGKALWQAKKQP